MSDRSALLRALSDLDENPEQRAAVHAEGHCVVLAGPGSGKTKTLTTAMAHALNEEVQDPQGVACITYNTECAGELEGRLNGLGVSADERIFIGTVHSFALTQIIMPYARCIPGLLPPGFRVASRAECKAAVEAAAEQLDLGAENPHKRWGVAREKRIRDIDRAGPNWRGRNPELADFIELYESALRADALIDFDDMPLIAFRMVQGHPWIPDALRARYPVLFVDEYQDLGHALHELVLLLCFGFGGGMRLFAVGDADQSIYAFNGANPDLLSSLTQRPDVTTIRLRFNYRSGARIIRASLGALGEERDYQGIGGAGDGELLFVPALGDLEQQAATIAATVVPALLARHPASEIAILYRAARHGDQLSGPLTAAGIPFSRTDGNALVPRSSPLARFLQSCAGWVTGGWKAADPPFARLHSQAVSLIYGTWAREAEIDDISRSLIDFLKSGIDQPDNAHAWLQRFSTDLVRPWRRIARNPSVEWDILDELLRRTDPATGPEMSLSAFAGRAEDQGQITLSTLHSAKGREFDAVVLFGMNEGEMPNWMELKSDKALREARRLFYVGVTRPRKELAVVYQDGAHSPWLEELYRRSQS